MAEALLTIEPIGFIESPLRPKRYASAASVGDQRDLP